MGGVKKKPANVHNTVYVYLMEEMMKKEKNDNRRRGLRKALSSILKYPLPLSSPAHTTSLVGIGPGIADRIGDGYARLLQDYGPEGVLDGTYLSSSSTAPAKVKTKKRPPPPVERAPQGKKQKTAASSTTTASKASKTRVYKPKKGSGAYALLMGLFRWQIEGNPSAWPGAVTKEELINVAQPLTESSFTAHEGGGRGAASSSSSSAGGWSGGMRAYSYTAWSNMAKLIKEGLVVRRGRPHVFALTPDGVERAITVLGSSSTTTTTTTTTSSSKTKGGGTRRVTSLSTGGAGRPVMSSVAAAMLRKTTSIPENLISPFRALGERTANLPVSNRYAAQGAVVGSPAWVTPLEVEVDMEEDAGSLMVIEAEAGGRSAGGGVRPDLNGTGYEVMLVVDLREVVGSHAAKQKMTRVLTRTKMKVEERTSSLGDFLFVAKHASDPNVEIVLDFIVERKVEDDMKGSIRDGRYRAQMARLLDSGVSRSFLLLESDLYAKSVLDTRYANDPSQIVKAMSTALHRIKTMGGNFHISRSMADTAQWLEEVYFLLVENLARDGIGAVAARHPENPDAFLTYQELQVTGLIAYNETVSSVFARMLLAVSGMSVDKAALVILKYPTLSHLMDAYAVAGAQGESAAKLMLQDLKHPDGTGQRFGKALSTLVWRLVHEDAE